MKLESKNLNDRIKQISLAGRLDIQGASEIENSFVMETATKRAAVLVDISGVEFIASYGMRFLLENAKALTKRGGKMVLCKPGPIVAETLKIAGLDQLIPVYDDFEAACADLEAAVS